VYAVGMRVGLAYRLSPLQLLRPEEGTTPAIQWSGEGCTAVFTPGQAHTVASGKLRSSPGTKDQCSGETLFATICLRSRDPGDVLKWWQAS